jgi:hypothetical protein
MVIENEDLSPIYDDGSAEIRKSVKELPWVRDEVITLAKRRKPRALTSFEFKQKPTALTSLEFKRYS